MVHWWVLVHCGRWQDAKHPLWALRMSVWRPVQHPHGSLPQGLNHVSTHCHAETHPIGYTPCTYHEGGFPHAVVSCPVHPGFFQVKMGSDVGSAQWTLISEVKQVGFSWNGSALHDIQNTKSCQMEQGGAQVQAQIWWSLPPEGLYMVKKPLAFF